MQEAITQREETMVLFLAKATEALRVLELLRTENDTYSIAKQELDRDYANRIGQLNSNYMSRTAHLIRTAIDRIDDLTPDDVGSVSELPYE